MAEEKKKKNIVVSDDDDDKDDKYSSCDKDSEETELSLVLNKLTLGPKNEKKKKKKLLVLGLNGLLLHRVHQMNTRKSPKNRSPDATCGPNLVYKRPFAEKFMKFCLERFEVGIWSSAYEKNVDAILNIILQGLNQKLLFVWDQDHCTDSGFKTLENSDKPLFFKDLSKVFKSFKCFSDSNTIFVDEEPYKALLNPENTGVFPLTYDPTNKNDNLLDPKGEFCSYLDDLANASDVKAYIKEHSFGQPMVDSSHPDWSFYSKVFKIVSLRA